MASVVDVGAGILIDERAGQGAVDQNGQLAGGRGEGLGFADPDGQAPVGGKLTIWFLNMADGRQPTVFLNTEFDESQPAISTERAADRVSLEPLGAGGKYHRMEVSSRDGHGTEPSCTTEVTRT